VVFLPELREGEGRNGGRPWEPATSGKCYFVVNVDLLKCLELK
jgi:hypothetical protein